MYKRFKENIELILDLSKNDIKTKYAGSYLGIIWAFVQPIITITVYWLVFQYGLRMGSTSEDVPYVLWFVTGIVPWFFFADALSSGTSCLKEYDYLVKKVIFPLKLLPIIKIISALFIHVVFVMFLTIIYGVYGKLGSINYLFLLYYMVCMSLLVLGLTYFTSSIVVFFKDLGQIINIILQVGMWATPILWDYKTTVPPSLLWVFKLNPMFYIVNGYRDSMLGGETPLTHWIQSIFFWLLILFLIVTGTKLFEKLKLHFADVL